MIRNQSDDWVNYQSSSGVVDTGEWTHIAVTAQFGAGAGESNIKMYVNNNFLRSFTTTDVPLSNAGLARIGADQYGRYWDGTLDDFRVYDAVLSPGEIEQNYKAIPEPSTLLLLGGGLLGLLACRRVTRR